MMPFYELSLSQERWLHADGTRAGATVGIAMSTMLRGTVRF